jgi:hypothetical protein
VEVPDEDGVVSDHLTFCYWFRKYVEGLKMFRTPTEGQVTGWLVG